MVSVSGGRYCRIYTSLLPSSIHKRETSQRLHSEKEPRCHLNHSIDLFLDYDSSPTALSKLQHRTASVSISYDRSSAMQAEPSKLDLHPARNVQSFPGRPPTSPG